MSIGLSDDMECYPLPTHRAMKIKVVMVYDDMGNYLLHGASNQEPAEMLKAVQSLWTIQPDNEYMCCFEFTVNVPVVDRLPLPYVGP